MHQIRFSLGLCPGPLWGSAPDLAGGAHDSLVGWRGGYPLPIPYPLDAYVASFSTLAAPHLELGGLAPRT